MIAVSKCERSRVADIKLVACCVVFFFLRPNICVMLFYSIGSILFSRFMLNDCVPYVRQWCACGRQKSIWNTLLNRARAIPFEIHEIGHIQKDSRTQHTHLVKNKEWAKEKEREGRKRIETEPNRTKQKKYEAKSTRKPKKERKNPNGKTEINERTLFVGKIGIANSTTCFHSSNRSRSLALSSSRALSAIVMIHISSMRSIQFDTLANSHSLCAPLSQT